MLCLQILIFKTKSVNLTTKLMKSTTANLFKNSFCTLTLQISAPESNLLHVIKEFLTYK